MSCLYYRDNNLTIEDVSLPSIADQFGTPTYVYSQTAIEQNWQSFAHAFQGFPARICYAVKANSNINILRLLAAQGAGFDIVSVGELYRVLAAGGDPSKVIFSGVGKSKAEIRSAIAAGIYCFNVESEPELDRLNAIANELQTIVQISLRVNPDVDALTHTYISTGLSENKFGIALDNVMPLCKKVASLAHLRLIGIGCHIGSQIVKLTPFLLALDCLLEMYQLLAEAGIKLQVLDLGGGLGITYRDEQPPTVADYAAAVRERLTDFFGKQLPIEIIIEPGRAIVGNAGILLTRVEYLKMTAQKNFAIVDAGMNDLLRPALYEAWQEILPVHQKSLPEENYDIAGPVCESADFLGRDRCLAIEQGDLLAIDTSGAYGFSMSSNYNSRCKPAEVMVKGNKVRIIRRRESYEELFAAENYI